MTSTEDTAESRDLLVVQGLQCSNQHLLELWWRPCEFAPFFPRYHGHRMLYTCIHTHMHMYAIEHTHVHVHTSIQYMFMEAQSSGEGGNISGFSWKLERDPTALNEGFRGGAAFAPPLPSEPWAVAPAPFSDRSAPCVGIELLGPCVGPYSLSFGRRSPSKPLLAKKGSFFFEYSWPKFLTPTTEEFGIQVPQARQNYSSAGSC